MSNVIIHKRSDVTGKRPLVTDLQLGELAINTKDGILFSKASISVGEIIKGVKLTNWITYKLELLYTDLNEIYISQIDTNISGTLGLPNFIRMSQGIYQLDYITPPNLSICGYSKVVYNADNMGNGTTMFIVNPTLALVYNRLYLHTIATDTISLSDPYSTIVELTLYYK
jgi:hypothetical protein